jgi:hypothetical protein
VRGIACVFVDDDRVEEAEAVHVFDVRGLWVERRVSKRSGGSLGRGSRGATGNGKWKMGSGKGTDAWCGRDGIDGVFGVDGQRKGKRDGNEGRAGERWYSM